MSQPSLDTEAQLPTKVLLQVWLDNQTSAKCTISSCSGRTLLILLLLISSSKVFQSAFVPGWTFNEYHTCSNTRTLVAINRKFTMIESYFKDIRQVILQELEKAHEEIHVAVCWFTNNQLFDLLCEKVRNKISVTLIVLNDSINNRDNGLDFQKFIDLGGKFYFGDIDKPMHNKYCLIDNKTLINGSYNWTYLAETNEENITIITESQTIQSFKNDFKRLMLITQPVNTVKEVANKDPKKSNIVEGSIIASTDFIIIESKQIISDSLYLISSVGESLHEDKFQIFFAKDTLIPSSKEITLTTVYDKQITCGKDIRFGENKIGSLNQSIGGFHVTGIPELPKGIPGLITTFEIDYNRILTVKVKIRENNKIFINKYDISKLIEKR